ncbi:MAG: biotin--[acetyl-CoA-carboxylase] ligase [Candidatus Omnitrophica bacterium]|nr:biotin--[acetyl-CoA-carboxylase] ligase [Candidatus Omnitrophota bacterium]
MTKPDKDLDYIILKKLKDDEGYTSGEELANKLKISRQALWKHINKLADKGYEIVATPHLGYKLMSCPDKFYPWEVQHNLNTRFIGKEVHHEEVIDSTQDLTWQLGLKGAPEGTVVFAQTQKKGRGRIQRQWISPRGGIYFSLLLKPDFLSIQEVPQITLLVALGCLRGIKKATGVECSVKWPNDIYLKGKKLGGILCEMNAEMDRIHFVVAGIGINVNSKDLPSQATSLFLNLKKKVSRVEIAKRILEEIEVCYRQAQREGFSNLLKEWGQFCLLWGKRVKVKVFDKRIEGEASGIDERGYLLLRKDNGLIEKVSAGDITKLAI